MADYMFVELDNTTDKTELIKNFILDVKIATINITTLHRNIKGGSGEWITVHQKLSEYYYTMINYEDKVVEAFMSIGYKDKDIDNCDKIIAAGEYNVEDALSITRDILNYLLTSLIKLRENVELPNSVNSTFDGFEEWLNIESNYILKNSLNGSEVNTNE